MGPPIRTDGTLAPAPCESTATDSFAFYGDAKTHIVDSIWKIRGCPEQDRAPLQRLPAALRLLEATVVEGNVYALVESVGFRGQPVGMRTWIDVRRGLATAIDAPLERAAARALLPPVIATDAAIFRRSKSGKPSPGHPWLSPKGMALEAVYQNTFHRSVGRVTPADPRFASVRDTLASGRFQCPRDYRSPTSIGRCWDFVAGFSVVAFEAPAGGSEGPPLLRSVGRAVSEDELLGGPTTPLDEAGHRRVLEGYLARQPIAGTLVAVGPLNRDGGSAGVFFSPFPKPRVYIVLVDGPAGALRFAPPLDELDHAGLTDTSVVEAKVLGPSGGDGYFGSARVRFERAGDRPWSGVFLFTHPLRGPKGEDFAQDRVPLQEDRTEP